MTVSTSKISKKRQIPSGIVHIFATFNNTIVTVTDTHGETLSASSAGANGYKGSRKSTPFAGQVAAKVAVTDAIKKFGIKTLFIKIKGPGSARESAVMAISDIIEKESIVVTSIKDVTPIPHNGSRPPKRRRV